VLGIRQDAPDGVEIIPHFLKKLNFARGYAETRTGRVDVEWKRNGVGIELNITVEKGLKAFYGGKRLKSGLNGFTLKG
jgi:hypothetical protein